MLGEAAGSIVLEDDADDIGSAVAALAKVTLDATSAFLSNIDRAIQERTDVNEEDFATYVNALEDKKRVIVIAHSQGNLFANEAIQRVHGSNDDYKKSINVFGVANPATFAVAGSNYVSAVDDGVIMISSTAGGLPPNLVNTP